MIYHISVLLIPYFSALNVFTYLTTRAGGAALTAFLLSLVVGPPLIRRLRLLKVGQFIREEHVHDLHALHKSKAGTPTMGGALIIITTVISVALWGRLDNRLLIVAVLVLCTLGAVGFLDDYIKLRRKRNEGMSAKAKFLGQIAVGLALGTYLVLNPITVDATYLHAGDINSWPEFVRVTLEDSAMPEPGPARALWAQAEPELLAEAARQAAGGLIPEDTVSELLTAINAALSLGTLDGAGPRAAKPYPEVAGANGENGPPANPKQIRANRVALEAAYPQFVAQSLNNHHTKVGIPGFKDVLIPMGAFYALFVLLIIVAASNAVNLTDGLDGLAIGASIMSLLAYTGIAYIISRADWSRYLFLTYVPEATELTVFGAAMLGAGLGFLWYNAHPAEVFMGDTGSLALGGVIGALAILTKQELLLLVVGGLFVLEAGSVIIQVASFKLRRKRVFKMAPLHHHFELSGWSESKVTVRFWILALVFALMSLTTLKLR